MNFSPLRENLDFKPIHHHIFSKVGILCSYLTTREIRSTRLSKLNSIFWLACIHNVTYHQFIRQLKDTVV